MCLPDLLAILKGLALTAFEFHQMVDSILPDWTNDSRKYLRTGISCSCILSMKEAQLPGGHKNLTAGCNVSTSWDKMSLI